MGTARHFEVFLQYLVKMYRELGLLTVFLAFLHVIQEHLEYRATGRPVNTFSFLTLSKETGRVLRDLPAQARPVSSQRSAGDLI